MPFIPGMAMSLRIASKLLSLRGGGRLDAVVRDRDREAGAAEDAAEPAGRRNVVVDDEDVAAAHAVGHRSGRNRGARGLPWHHGGPIVRWAPRIEVPRARTRAASGVRATRGHVAGIPAISLPWAGRSWYILPVSRAESQRHPDRAGECLEMSAIEREVLEQAARAGRPQPDRPGQLKTYYHQMLAIRRLEEASPRPTRRARSAASCTSTSARRPSPSAPSPRCAPTTTSSRPTASTATPTPRA